MNALAAQLPNSLQAMLVVAALVLIAGICMYFVLTPNRRDLTRARMRAIKARLNEKEEPQTKSHVDFLTLFGRHIINSPLIGAKEEVKIVALLNSAGLTGRGNVGLFVGLKTGLALLFLGLAEVINHYFIGELSLAISLGGMFGPALLGWRLPDVVVGFLARKRRKMLADGLGDALDLLVICVEAGLGMEQAIDRVGRDLAVANPVMSFELRKTLNEMRFLPRMRDALDNLAVRSGVPAFRSVVTTLIQSMQYGTPLAHSLRVLSAEMRQRRILEMEEKAGRLPVMLTIPLVLFILPCLFLVIVGPLAIHIMDTLSKGK